MVNSEGVKELAALKASQVGAWVAVGQATAFGSGRDPGVPGSSPTSGSLLSRGSASPSALFPLVPSVSHSLSLSNK